MGVKTLAEIRALLQNFLRDDKWAEILTDRRDYSTIVQKHIWNKLRQNHLDCSIY